MAISLDIEESQKFAEQGIIVVKKGNQKFYCFVRGTGDKRYPFELIPLTLAQCKKFEITETFHDNDPSDFETNVEESEKKEPEKVDLRSEADRKKAKEMLEKAEKVYGSDSEKEELRERAEDAENKLQMLSEIAFQKKKRELNAPDSITTIEALKAYEEGLKQKENAGSAPLNDFQLHGAQGAKETFSSYEELVKALYAAKTPQSEAILNKLWEKTIQQLKSGSPVILSAPVPEAKGNAKEVEVMVDPNGRETEPSELERLGVKKKTHRSQMRHVDKEGNPI